MIYGIRNVRQTGEDDGWREYSYDFYKNGVHTNMWYFDTVGEPTLNELRDALQRMIRIEKSFHCLDCGVHTAEAGEYYMVQNHIWKSAGLEYDGGMVCIGCLEARIGRKLLPEDFPNYPVNDPGSRSKSERLISRITGLDSTLVAVLN
jgi:hypothetical protein